ncbi:MAG: hypothetical protein HYS89_01665 [Candidatus Colwellbacteria bacterium]|nr:hypothetical protein [Candidatus Colwellbacteria bacterium]
MNDEDKLDRNIAMGIVVVMLALALAFGWSYFQPLPRWAYAVGAIFFVMMTLAAVSLALTEARHRRKLPEKVLDDYEMFDLALLRQSEEEDDR